MARSQIEKIEYLYLEEEKSISEIANFFGVSNFYISELMKQEEVPTRSRRVAAKLAYKNNKKTATHLANFQFKKGHLGSKGKLNPFYGKTHTEKTKAQLSETIKHQYENGRLPWNKGKPYPQIRGEKHPYWRGGKKSYYGSNWYFQRRQTLERDNYACRVCDIKNKSSDVHHLKSIRKFSNLEDANTLNNLITLCHSCHIKVERGVIKL